MAEKTISELEKETGMFLTGKHDPSKKMERKPFSRMATEKGFVGVNYKFRVEFLKKNGYELTRENLMNPELSVRSQDGEE